MKGMKYHEYEQIKRNYIKLARSCNILHIGNSRGLKEIWLSNSTDDASDWRNDYLHITIMPYFWISGSFHLLGSPNRILKKKQIENDIIPLIKKVIGYE